MPKFYNFHNPIVVFVIMSTFLYTLLGLTVGTSLHCAVRKEIEPCTCRKESGLSQNIYVTCERMVSFEQIVGALENHFSMDDHIILDIAYSNLSDLALHNFQELKVPIFNLKLNHDQLRDVTDDTFLGLHKTDYLSLADNELSVFPRGILSRMPGLKSLDIGRGRLTQILENDFANSKTLQHLFLPGNMINIIEKNSLPKSLRHLHLGRNQIPHLNGTIREMTELEWLFINANQLTSLEGQLPEDFNKLTLIHASDNHLQHLPQEFKNLHRIETLFFEHNKLVGFDGTLRKAKRLTRLVVSHNNIMVITPDDFAEAESLEDLQMGYNNLTSLNGSLAPLRSLRCVNLTHNFLTEFSLQEIRGLRRLRVIDLSNNKISKLVGRMQNVVEWDTRVMDIKLDYNELTSLDGALSGLHGLLYLNLSHNHLTKLSPGDLIGLDVLRWVDFSFNKLTTLYETSLTTLPALERLIVTNNYLTELQHDFDGLPVLCWADLSYNNIRSVSRDLVAKTRCNVHGSPAALRLLLEDNPVLCDSALPELISELEVNNTRLLGRSHCPPPAEITTMITTTTLADKNINEMQRIADATNNNSNVIEINAPPIILSSLINASTNTQYVIGNLDNSGDKSDNILPEIQHLDVHLEADHNPQQSGLLQKTVIIHHGLSEDGENPTKHVRAVD